jgi:hypothetical protein
VLLASSRGISERQYTQPSVGCIGSDVLDCSRMEFDRYYGSDTLPLSRGFFPKTGADAKGASAVFFYLDSPSRGVCWTL